MATTTISATTSGTGRIIYRCSVSGGDWDTAHDASSGDNVSNSIFNGVYLDGGKIAIGRGFIVFNTSGIPDGASILSAKVQIYVTSKNADNNFAFNVTNNSQSSATNLSASDYNDLGTTRYAVRYYNDISLNTWNDWTLNSTGRSAINKTGYTKMGLREAHDFDDSDPGDNPGGGDGNYIDADESKVRLYVEYAESPTVTTGDVSNLLGTSADYSGNVTDDGGGTVSTRGICWSTSSNPTTSNSKDASGSGTGSFTSNLTGLSKGTTYHVRAYATNEAGTSYGADETFTTKDDPAVTTGSVSNNNMHSASYSGNVTDDGDGTVSTRGICWSTSSNPTTSNSKNASGSGTGEFTSSLTSLKPGVTYHVRAYATNEVSTQYGADETFTTFMGGGMV